MSKSLRQRIKNENLLKASAASNENIVTECKTSKYDKLFDGVPGELLVIFRVLWGSIMLLEIFTYIEDDFAKMNFYWYSNPQGFRFQYWYPMCEEGYVLPLLDPLSMKIFLLSMMLCSIFVILGFFYRTSSGIFLVGITYMFYLDATWYLNHIYLCIVICVLVYALPCNCMFSLDSYFFPSYYSSKIPRWTIYVLRFQFFVVYFYAGAAKINLDWLRAEPLRHWLSNRFAVPFVGWLLPYEWSAYIFSYSGIFLDLFCGFLLCSDRLRWIGITTTISFHFMNQMLFNIGVFPWVMMASTFLFCSPNRISSLCSDVASFVQKRINYVPNIQKVNHNYRKPSRYIKWLIVAFLTLFVVYQVAMPLRSMNYPGGALWNGHGYRYSWRMKLNNLECDFTTFSYHNVTQEWFEVPSDWFLTARQYQKAMPKPEFILQHAHLVSKAFTTEGIPSEVYSVAICRSNYREIQNLVNSTVNLANEKVWDWPATWIVPQLPLSKAQKKQFPWNGITEILSAGPKYLVPFIRIEQKELADAKEIFIDNSITEWMDWLLDEKFHGNKQLAKKKYRSTQEDKIKSKLSKTKFDINTW